MRSMEDDDANNSAEGLLPHRTPPPPPPPSLGDPAAFAVPFLAAVLVLGTAGNALVLAVYSRRRYRRPSPNAALYIVNLALSDLMALAVVLFHITEFYPASWPVLWRTDAQCRLHRYLRFVSFDLTVFSMVAIAVDRYFAVVRPLRFRLTFTARRTKMICLAVWCAALAAAVPTPFMFEAFQMSDSGNSTVVGGEAMVTYTGKLPFACRVVTPFGPWWPDFKSIYLNVVLFYAPAAVTAALYAVIVLHVRRATRLPALGTVRRRAGAAGPPGPVPGPVRRRGWRSARTLLAVFLAYLLCYGSFATYNVLSRYAVAGTVPASVYNACLLLPYANSCANPVIYSFINPAFRGACRDLLLARRPRRRRRRSAGRRSRGPASASAAGGAAAQMSIISEGALEYDSGMAYDTCVGLAVSRASSEISGSP